MSNFSTASGPGPEPQPEYTHHRALQAAQKYQEAGRAVLPCLHADDPEDPKAPVGRLAPHGVHSASKDEKRVAAMWRSAPGASIGVAAGRASGIVALDVDIKSGEDGPASLEKLEREYGELPRTRTIRTPSGGGRLEFAYSGELPSSKGRLGPGIEVKADNTYFVAYPSPGYELLDDAPYAPLPEWISELAREPEEKSKPEVREPSSLDDRELLDSARRSEDFRRLYDEGDWSGFQSQSEADFSLVNLLISRAGNDREQVIRLFEASALYRRPPGKHWSYIGRTVDNALRSYRGSPSTGPDRETRKLLAEIESAYVWNMPWTGSKWKSPRSVVVSLIKLGREYGERIPAGLRVSISLRDLALAAGISLEATRNAVNRLRESGILRRDDRDRRGTESGALVLVAPPRQPGTLAPQLGATNQCGERTNLSRPARFTVPRLRWSAPKYEREGDVLVRYTLRRLGKSVEQFADTLEYHGGDADWADLAEAMGVSRVRDLRRGPGAKLASIGAVEDLGDRIRFTEDWLERVNERREADEEITAYRRDMKRYDRERTLHRVRYHAHTGLSHEEIAEKLGMGLDRVRLILKDADPTPATRSIEEARAVADVPDPALRGDELVHGDTGEVLDDPGYQDGWSEEDHLAGCCCPACYYEELRLEAS